MRPSAGLCRLLEDVGGASGLEEACSTLDRRLHELLPFHAMAVYAPVDGRLRPVYGSPGTAGGEGMAGWVAATRRPAFHRDPPCPSEEPAANQAYGSMLAVPLDDGPDLVGVLSLYSRERNAFGPQDLGVLLWIREDLARAVRHALDGREAATASSDPRAVRR
jgi:hypothetical protein